MARLILLTFVAGCCAASPRTTTPRPPTVADAVVWDFEQKVLEGQQPYLALFDLAAVGKYEKLLHRYDLLGRAELTPEQQAQFAAEDATPFTVKRETYTVGAFYPILGTRTVGAGGCQRVEPVSEYGAALGRPFEPLPAGLESYEPLRLEVNAMIAKGGIVALKCKGGTGRLVLVWTASASARGYDLISMYDDVE